MIIENTSEIIGKTPILECNRYIETFNNNNAFLYAKLEYLNPTGSVKDRAALFMINDAEKNGMLKRGGTIIEPTSGNTGIGLASIATIRGYRLILTMPETMSIERRNLLKAYGAEIVLTEGSKGMNGAVEKANELRKEIDNSIILGQFDNESNVKAHIETTGPEIWNDLNGDIDTFVATFGTGGTITGTSKYLKSKNKNIKIVAVEPDTSPLLSANIAGPHKIQGIGANFIPKILDRKIIDVVKTTSYEKSILEAKNFARSEGILVGISSGAALSVAKDIILNGEGKKVVVILPDSADRYMSTELFKFEETNYE